MSYEAQILDAIRALPDLSGFQISDVTGMWNCVMYPTLLTLEQSGQIESRWCDEDASYPRRRVYRIKGDVS